MKQALPVVVGLLLSFGVWDDSRTGCSLRADADARRAGHAGTGRRGPAGRRLRSRVRRRTHPDCRGNEFGARGVGIEIDPALVTQAQAKAREAGVEDKVEFRLGDMYAADVRPATVVTLFLHPKPNLKLRPEAARRAAGRFAGRFLRLGHG